MLIIVVVLFVVCWMPLQIYNLLKEIYPNVNLYQYIHIIWFCSNWLAMSNSCYNPFIYGLLNEKFKREFRLLFKMCPYWKKEEQDLMDYSEDSIACRKFSIVVNNSMAYHSSNGNLPQAKRYSRMTPEITEHTIV
ncbi:hypothetical protein ScPMuIL_004851 [Solemya velum]